jgi:hypothetical protein
LDERRVGDRVLGGCLLAVSRENLRGTAEELRRAYAHLLTVVRPSEPVAACERLEEARQRLTGREPDPQLTLDILQPTGPYRQHVPGPNVENIRSSQQAKQGVEPMPKGQRRR